MTSPQQLMISNQLSPKQAARQEFTAQESNIRLDQFLANQRTGLSRSRIHALITEGFVLLNGQSARPSQKVRLGDRVALTVPPPRGLDLVPQSIPLTVVYQDEALIVIDKPAGLS